MKPLRKISREMLIVAVVGLVALLFTAMPVLAKVKGPCANCHTMHNSQDGVSMAFLNSGAADDTPNARLLRYSCVGCHTNSVDLATIADFTPKVYTTGAPAGTGVGDSLAGGNFYYVTTDDGCGHNVTGITALEDATLDSDPPGFVSKAGPHATPRGTLTTTSGAGWANNRLTCAGNFGCHGDPSETEDLAALSGAHHGDGGLDGFCFGGTTLSTSYRFLYGIKGVEDADWEDTVAVDDHNQYHGIDRTANITLVDKTTISHLCCECHGDFHVGQTLDDGTADNTAASYAAPWNRHPTDFDLNNLGGEYAQFNDPGKTGSGVGVYSFVAPVGSDLSALASTVSGSAQIVQNVLTADKAIVTCISCHRAHATEFQDILRWDYMDEDASGDMYAASGVPGGSGCFICHTTKDDQ